MSNSSISRLRAMAARSGANTADLAAASSMGQTQVNATWETFFEEFDFTLSDAQKADAITAVMVHACDNGSSADGLTYGSYTATRSADMGSMFSTTDGDGSAGSPRSSSVLHPTIRDGRLVRESRDGSQPSFGGGPGVGFKPSSTSYSKSDGEGALKTRGGRRSSVGKVADALASAATATFSRSRNVSFDDEQARIVREAAVAEAEYNRSRDAFRAAGSASGSSTPRGGDLPPPQPFVFTGSQAPQNIAGPHAPQASSDVMEDTPGVLRDIDTALREGRSSPKSPVQGYTVGVAKTPYMDPAMMKLLDKLSVHMEPTEVRMLNSLASTFGLSRSRSSTMNVEQLEPIAVGASSTVSFTVFTAILQPQGKTFRKFMRAQAAEVQMMIHHTQGYMPAWGMKHGLSYEDRLFAFDFADALPGLTRRQRARLAAAKHRAVERSDQRTNTQMDQSTMSSLNED